MPKRKSNRAKVEVVDVDASDERDVSGAGGGRTNVLEERNGFVIHRRGDMSLVRIQKNKDRINQCASTYELFELAGKQKWRIEQQLSCHRCNAEYEVPLSALIFRAGRKLGWIKCPECSVDVYINECAYGLLSLEFVKRMKELVSKEYDEWDPR